MSPRDHDAHLEEPQLTRRQWLGLAITSAMAAAAASIGYTRLSPEDEQQQEKQPAQRVAKFTHAGDQTRPLRQQEINDTYARLYDTIKDAKEYAELRGKKLVILMGDNHSYSLSLLNGIMVTDIAARLGIKDFFNEVNPHTLDQWEATLPDMHNRGRRLARSLMQHDPVADNLLSRYDGLGPEQKKEVDLSSTLLFGIPTSPAMEGYVMQGRRTLQHSGIIEAVAHMHEMALKPGHDIQGTPAKFTGKEVEDSMTEHLSQPGAHRICRNGLAHLPTLYNTLRKDPSLHVIAIDTSNQQYGFPEDLHIERVATLKAMMEGKDPNVHKITLHGQAPDFMGAYVSATKASLAHRHTHDVQDPVSHQQATALSGMMEKLQDVLTGKDTSRGR